MKYIFDTDCFTLALREDSQEYASIHARAAELLPDDDLVTTIITYEEQTRGWLGLMAKRKDINHQVFAYGKLKQHLVNYLGWGVLEFDAGAAFKFDQLRAMKLRVGTADLKIGAIALSLGAIVVTRNSVDFSKVPGLKFEDWTR